MDKEKSKQGRKNRASGAEFERRVRDDLSENNWIVAKWTNTVEFTDIGVGDKPEIIPLKIGKLVRCKSKFNPVTKQLMMNTGGFPDFIAFKGAYLYNIIGVEAKSNGYLSKEEKEKCVWLLKNRIFNQILVAKKGERGEIKYKDFEKLK